MNMKLLLQFYLQLNMRIHFVTLLQYTKNIEIKYTSKNQHPTIFADRRWCGEVRAYFGKGTKTVPHPCSSLTSGWHRLLTFPSSVPPR